MAVWRVEQAASDVLWLRWQAWVGHTVSIAKPCWLVFQFKRGMLREFFGNDHATRLGNWINFKWKYESIRLRTANLAHGQQ